MKKKFVENNKKIKQRLKEMDLEGARQKEEMEN